MAQKKKPLRRSGSGKSSRRPSSRKKPSRSVEERATPEVNSQEIGVEEPIWSGEERRELQRRILPERRKSA